MVDVKFHIQRLGQLRTDRSMWDTQWEEAAARAMPAYRDSFLSRGFGSLTGGGEKKTEQMVDSTAAFAAMRFSTVIESITTPQSQVWHLLRVLDPVLKRNRAVRMFFDEFSELLYNYRYRPVANFVGQSQQTYQGLGVFGNGVLFIDRSEQVRGLRYKNIHLAEAYFVENHQGVVDTLYRSWMPTVSQIVKQFGEANCPKEIVEMASSATQSETKKEVLHCVFPREGYDPQRVDPKGMPFASVYILVEQQVPLRESGYMTFPYAVTRYTQASGEVYGRGPMQYVLPTVKLLNEQKKVSIKQGHRVVDPVLLAHDDGNLSNFSLRPGALNAGGISKDGKRLIDVLPTGNLAVADKHMEMEKAVINDAFLITLFQILVDTPQMTATEVLERAKEKGMLLAPTAGRLQSEFLGPLIEREIDLMAQQGLLPRIPPILRDAAIEYKVEYDNPLSRMARSEKAAGFLRALGTAAEYTKMTGDAEPLDWFDFDTAMPEIQDIQGAPARWTRSPEEVAARREARAQQVRDQQMIEAAPALAATAKTVMPAAKA